MRMTPARARALIPAAALLATGGLVHAQQSIPQENSFSPQAEPCFTTLTSGNGDHYMRVCVSATGNVVRFRTGAFEHLRVGVPMEGYVLCLPDTSYAPAWDVGIDEDLMGPASILQPNGPNTFPLTITRIARPGGQSFRVSQTFERNIYEHELKITMRVTNLSGADVPGLRLERFFDADIAGDWDDDVFVAARDTVVSLEPGGKGVSLTATTFDRSHDTGIRSFFVWDSGNWRVDCRQHDVVGPTAPGDYVGSAGYDLGSINAGASRTVRFVYRGF